jgi:hypothetical protein
MDERSYKTPNGDTVEIISNVDGKALVCYISYANGAIAEYPEYDKFEFDELTEEKE